MAWMNFAGARGSRIRPFAGFYLRTPGRTRFWGWGEPPLTAASTTPAAPAAANPVVANPDRPWAALGDWLRTAHAMFGSDDPKQAQTGPRVSAIASGKSSDRSQTVEEHKGWERKRLRFVCNRHLIGFVFD